MKRYFTYSSVLILLFATLICEVFGQQPRNIPKPNGEPLRLDNWPNIIIFVIIPILAFIFFLIWKRRKRKLKNKD